MKYKLVEIFDDGEPTGNEIECTITDEHGVIFYKGKGDTIEGISIQTNIILKFLEKILEKFTPQFGN